MDQQVDGDRNPLHRGETNELGVAQESGGAVVVGMEEGQRLLLQDQENGVQEFDVFVDIIKLFGELRQMRQSKTRVHHIETYIVQDDKRLGPSAPVVTDAVEDAVACNGGQELLDEQGQQDGADDGQEQVVDHEQGVQLECGELLHDLAAAEDHGVVGDQDGRGLLEGGQWSDTLDELELAGRIAHYLLISLIKQRPQVNAKRSVEGWEGHILEELGRHGERCTRCTRGFDRTAKSQRSGKGPGQRQLQEFETTSDAVAKGVSSREEKK